jgi:hypothetical protein
MARGLQIQERPPKYVVVPCGLLAREIFRMYCVYFEEPGLWPQLVCATRFQVEGEHLVFLREDGRLVALFFLEIVKEWVDVGF